MDSYRVEKPAAMKIQLPDEDAEIDPVPTSGGGAMPEPELDRLSNILKAFNDQFGNIPWTDEDRIRRLITEEIPAKVAADEAYQNAQANTDKQNARIEHDKALGRVMNVADQGRHGAVQAVQRQRVVPQVAARDGLRAHVPAARGGRGIVEPGLHPASIAVSANAPESSRVAR